MQISNFPLLTAGLIACITMSAGLVAQVLPHKQRVTVAGGRLDIRLTKGKERLPDDAPFSSQEDRLVAQVDLTLTLRNESDQRDDNVRQFPILAPADSPAEWCRVSVNGQRVDALAKHLLPQQSNAEVLLKERRATWNRRVNEWIREDEVLQKMVARYHNLCGDRHTLSRLIQEFDVEVKNHLIESEVALPARYVAQGDSTFSYLATLIAEVDPALRINEAFQGRKYISLIGSFDTNAFQPYETEWRAKVEAWFAGRPKLSEAATRLRTAWTSFQQGQDLLSNHIVKYVHDEKRLDLNTSLQFRDFLRNGATHPSLELVCGLFPDVARLLDAQHVAESAVLEKWGFDQSVMSPFTGMLLPDSIELPRFDWHDPSVNKILKRRSRERTTDRHRIHEGLVPSLLSFSLPLDARAAANVKIEYLLPAAIVSSPYASSRRRGFPELGAMFPSADNTIATLTIPERTYAIVTPSPQHIKLLEDGQIRFTSILSNKANTLHLKPIRINGQGSAYLDRFARDTSGLSQELSYVIDRVSNMSVRGMLRSARYLVLLREDPWAAHQLKILIDKQHPELTQCFEGLTHSEEYASGVAMKMHEWCNSVISSPVIETDEDFHRFTPKSSNDTYTLTRSALTHLARSLEKTPGQNWSTKEKMGRMYILSEAGIESKKNLSAMLELASRENEIYLLKLISNLHCEKSVALPWVLAKLDPDIRSKRIDTSSHEWKRQNVAYSTLRSFRNLESAGPIIAFITTTRDSLLVQGAIDAMSELSLPDRFEDLVAIADRVSHSSESAFIQYLNLLIRSDRQRAIPVLLEFRDSYPKYNHRILTALSKAGYDRSLSEAMAIYHDANFSHQELQAAVGVLRELAGPQDIAALDYRPGLEQWMNESLVSVIRFRGGSSEAFPFVESYFLEFIKGKRKHNHLTCVDAFAQIGDARAIPYLLDVLLHTDRKQDAAEAIGRIMHPQHIKRSKIDNPLDSAIQTITRTTATEEETDRAWKLLLADRPGAVDRMLNYGPLHAAIEGTRPGELKIDPVDFAYLKNFGDVAAAALLESCDECSLEKRYLVAQLLRVLLPESAKAISACAADETVDSDRRMTAQLALESK